MEEYIILCYQILMNIEMHGIGERTGLGIFDGRLYPFMDPFSGNDLEYSTISVKYRKSRILFSCVSQTMYNNYEFVLLLYINYSICTLYPSIVGEHPRRHG